MRKSLLLFLLLTSLFAEENCAPSFKKVGTVKPKPQENEPLVRSIVLINGKTRLLPASVLRQTDGIVVVDVDLPSSKGKLEEDLNCFIATPTPFTKDNVRKIKEQLYEYYRYYDHPFVLISLPKQIPNTGVVQLVVNESRLGKVEVTGNEWTSSKQYGNYFSIKPGQPISQKQLVRDVNFMNRNPYRQVSVIYSPGKELYTTDLTLEVTDRKPYFFYAGFDNTGVPTTGRQRVFAGFSWDQMFGCDQTFFYQYTTNYHVQRFHANAFQYMAMLPWRAIFNLYGGFSVVHADLPFTMKNTGTSVQGSIRYITPFVSNCFFSHEISVGFDLKNTNNTVEFVDIAPVYGQTVNLSQWMIGYSCKYERGCTQIEGGVEGYFSPFEWLPGQSNADFSSLRPGAVNRWFYGVGYMDMNYPMPHRCNFFFKTKIEGSSGPLLPSEQLGIGGYASVRGYDERQYSADNGFLMTAEFQSPRFTVIPTKKKSLSNTAYFLVFTDGGFGFDETKVPEIPWSDFLVSIGAGFRYRLGTYLNARCDYGIKLHRQDDFTGGPAQIHFSVSGSY